MPLKLTWYDFVLVVSVATSSFLHYLGKRNSELSVKNSDFSYATVFNDPVLNSFINISKLHLVLNDKPQRRDYETLNEL